MKYILVLSFLILSSCANNYLADKEDVWITSGAPLSNKIFYCEANKTKDARSKPTCLEANILHIAK